MDVTLFNDNNSGIVIYNNFLFLSFWSVKKEIVASKKVNYKL